MIEVFKLSIFAIFYFGFLNLISYIVKKNIWESIKSFFIFNNLIFCSSLFFVSSIWFISLGIISILCSSFFYLNINNYFLYPIFFILGFIGLFVFINDYFYKNKINLNFYTKINHLNFVQLSLLFLIIFLFMIYIFKSFIFWYDQDEIQQYGYYSKLISNGWTIEDNLIYNWYPFGSHPKFAESASAFFYTILENNFIPKLIRTFGIFFNTILIYVISKYLTKSITLSLLASCAFLVTPELAYISTSMKVDVILLGFELIAIIYFLFVLFSLDFKKINNHKFPNFVINSLILAVIFSIFALNTRMSGLYLLVIISTISSFLIFKFSSSYFKIFKYFIYLFLVFVVSSSALIYNLFNYFNPFYPIHGPWMFFFKGGASSQRWSISSENMIDNINYNIDIGIPIINEIYILFYHALGFENEVWSFLNLSSIPDKAVTGWLTPVLLCVFLTPFYFKKSLNIFLMLSLFLLCFIFWINGIQLSRIFVASSSISILICVTIISIKNKKLIYLFLNKILLFSLIVVILSFTYYQIRWASHQNPYGFKVLYNNLTQFESNTRKANMKLWFMSHGYDNFEGRLKAKDLFSHIISFDEINDLNDKINKLKGKLVILNNLDMRYLHIFFKKGHHISLESVKPYNSKSLKVKLEYLHEKKYNFDCLITKDNNLDYLNNFFPLIIYQSNNNLKLLCKKNVSI